MIETGGSTMQIRRHEFWMGLALALPMLLGPAQRSHADPGDIEINQDSAGAGFITPGDSPGFPITITESGNYILTSPLDVTGEPNPQNVSVIIVDAPKVSIDMSGKGIIGPNVCTPPPAQTC
jgi:hypothetical protein